MSLRNQWYAEKESAWLYASVAAAEPDADKRRLFERLAEGAEEQAGIILEQIRKSDGDASSDFSPSLRARVVAVLTRMVGPRRARHVLAAMKIRGLSIYSVPATQGEHPVPQAASEIGTRHKQSLGGMNLRAAVFGINDGLVSNASLIMGVAGASVDTSLIIVSGVAGMLAGAFSMASGEYLSVRSQRELYEYQIGLEEEELKLYPEEEAEELALIYGARGVPIERAREMASLIFKNPTKALRTMAIEELGVNPDELGSPWGAASSSFIAFFIGAALPLAPFVVATGSTALLAAAAVSAAGLFVVGAALSLLSGKGAVRGGLRMLAIGGGAGLATYAIGSLVGVSLND